MTQNLKFYDTNPQGALRLGDVVVNFIYASSKFGDTVSQFSINVEHPTYTVIITPCCSIAKNVVVAPLRRVHQSFFSNSNWCNDLTCLNRVMLPQQSVPPDKWDKMNEDEKKYRFGDLSKPGYACLEYFIYAPHEQLQAYPLKGVAGILETNYYMIDFRELAKAECNVISQATDHKVNKILELSVVSRNELRNKISNYYGRIPKEDSLKLGETT